MDNGESGNSWYNTVMTLETRDVMFTVDPDGHITQISGNCANLTGYSPDELTSGLPPPNWIVHPADYERMVAQAQAAVGAPAREKNESEAIECRIIRKDGLVRWVSVALAPVYKANRLVTVQGMARDVTNRKQVELALRERTQELAALNLLATRLSQSLDPMTILAEALGILMDVVEAEFGGAYQVRDGRHPSETQWLIPQVIHGLPDDFENDIAPYAHHFFQPSRIDVLREYQHESAGRVGPVGKRIGIQSWTILPLRERDTVFGLIVLAARDYEQFGSGDMDFLVAAAEHISLEVRNARLFAETQRRLTELALLNEAGRAVTSTLDREAVLHEIMTRAIEVLQSEAGSVMLLEPGGDLVFAVAAGPFGETLRGVRVPLASSLAGQAAREARPLMVLDAQSDPRLYRAVDARTTLVTRSLLAVPLIVRGEVIGVLEAINKRGGQFTAADLSLLESLARPAAAAIENARLYEQAVQRAEQLQRSQAQLIQSEKLAAMGRLTASLAHEINNPLQAILNFLHLALDYPIDEARRRDYLEITRDETRRLAQLVAHMLDFYRPTQQAQPHNVDVNATLERVLALSAKKLQTSNVQVKMQLADKLPPAAGVLDQIAQVFLNLVVNAAEAMSDSHRHGGRLTVASRLDANGQWIEVSFSDDGPGIAAQDLPHIFEPFYTTKQSGTGLGLSVSYGIVEAYGGAITVSSAPGQGATFTVRLRTASPPPRRRRKKKTV